MNGSYQKEVDLLCSMFQINLSNLLDNLDDSSIIEGYHIIYCPFTNTKNILMRYGWSFYDDMFFEDKLILRKDIKKNLRDKTKK